MALSLGATKKKTYSWRKCGSACVIWLMAGSSTAFAQAGWITGWPPLTAGVQTSSVGIPLQQYHTPPGAFVSLATGWYFSAGIRVGGTLHVWGTDAVGVSGHPMLVAPSDTGPFVQVSCAWTHGIALKWDGTVVGWGQNTHGETNQDPQGGLCPTCLPIPYDTEKFWAVSAGEYFSVGLVRDDSSGHARDRTVRVWGDPEIAYWPVNLPANQKFLKVLAGGHHVVGLKDNGNGTGSIVSWGYYLHGTPACSTYPFATPNCNNLCDIPIAYVDIAAGHLFDLALRADGTIDVYGAHDEDEQNVPGGGNFGWGGQCALPPGPSNASFSQLFAGRQHAMARGAYQSPLVWWGNNPHVYDDPVPPANSAQIWGVTSSAHSAHHLGLIGCYANCDASTAPPVLNANDFQCFSNAFAALAFQNPSDPGVLEAQIWSIANCDGSTTDPVLTSNDFQCFLSAYAAGCT